MDRLEEHIDGYDSHLTKLRNRLDVAYKDAELKEYCNALLAYGTLIIRLINMRKGEDDAAGSTVRQFATAFKNAASRGKADTGLDADAAAADLAAVKRQLWADHPDLHIKAGNANGGDDAVAGEAGDGD